MRYCFLTEHSGYTNELYIINKSYLNTSTPCQLENEAKSLHEEMNDVGTCV